MLNSIFNRDFPVVQGVTLVFAIMVVLINLLTDLAHARPRPPGGARHDRRRRPGPARAAPADEPVLAAAGAAAG